MQKVKVWDLPVRICHWLLVFIILFQYLSAEVLDENWLNNPLKWHFYAGYTCIGIVVFRVCWGLLGTKYAKFANFMVSPTTVFKYFKSTENNQYLGHNPGGAYSVIVLLSLIITQAISGLFISDEIFSDGPYYGVLGSDWQAVVNFLHHNVFYILLGFIALHVGAIIYYKIKKKQSLTSAMMTGNKQLTSAQHKTDIQTEASFPWLGLIASLVITAIVLYLVIEVLPPPPADDFLIY